MINGTILYPVLLVWLTKVDQHGPEGVFILLGARGILQILRNKEQCGLVFSKHQNSYLHVIHAVYFTHLKQPQVRQIGQHCNSESDDGEKKVIYAIAMA